MIQNDLFSQCLLPGGGLLSLQEVADALGVSLRQVRRYADAGKLRVSRLSERTVRVKAADLAAFVDATAVPVREVMHSS